MTKKNYRGIALRRETYELFETIKQDRFGTHSIPTTDAMHVVLSEYAGEDYE